MLNQQNIKVKEIISTIYNAMYQRNTNISYREKSIISFITLFVLIIGIGFSILN